MRSNEERVAAVKLRVKELEVQRRRRRNKIAALSSVAASFVIIVLLAFTVPGTAAQIAIGDYAGYEASASIFAGSVTIGYIAIGLMSFVLGVMVTVLCFKLKDLDRRDVEDRNGRAD